MTTDLFDLSPQLDEITPEWRDLVHRCVQLLSGVCDGARELDGKGFSGVDAGYGNSIARLPLSAVSDEHLVTAAEMLRKYRKQLVRMGFDVDQIAKPPADVVAAAKTKRAIRTVTFEDNELVVRFGFDDDLVREVKRLPGRRFEYTDKSWRVPLTSKKIVLSFASQFEFAVAEGVADATVTEDETGPTPGVPALGARKVDRGTLDAAGDLFSFRFPYNRELQDVIGALPGRRWDPQARRWTVPLYLVRRVRAIAEQWNLEISDAARAVPDHDPDVVPVTATVDGERLLVRFPFREEMAEMMRGLGFARWNRAESAWVMSVLHAEQLLAAIEASGALLGGDGDTLRKQLEIVAYRVDASRSLDSDFDVPGVQVNLAGFQRAGIEYALQSKQLVNGQFGGVSCFVADPVGLGKTRQGIGVLEAVEQLHEKAYPALIVVPNTLTTNWLREVTAAVPHRMVAMLSSTKAKPFGDLWRPDILIAPYSVIKTMDVKDGWAPYLTRTFGVRSVVLDESQMIKNDGTLRAQALIELSDELPTDGVRLCLSGTPVTNRRAEFVSQLRFLHRLEEFGGKQAVRTMGDVNDRLRAAGCFVRRTKHDVMPQLPPMRHAPLVIPPSELDPDAMRQYRRAETEFLAYLRDRVYELATERGIDDPMGAAMEAVLRASGAEHMVRIGHLKQLAARAKLPAARRWVAEFLATGDKLLVFANHLEMVDKVGDEWDAPTIQGKVPVVERQMIVDRFQTKPEVNLLVLQLATGGTGLTLTEASNVAFLEFGWTPAIHDQAVGRCYGRMNDPHGAVGWWITAEGTIDEEIRELIADKRAEVDNATDGMTNPDVEVLDDPDGSGSVLGDLVVSLAHRALSQ